MTGFKEDAFAADELPARVTLTFNREWKFQLVDRLGAEVVTFYEVKWENIGPVA